MFFRVKSKKGVSVMVGYVLLVTFAVIIGMIVYQWMRTYVPQEDLNCPDGVSLFIEDYTCASSVLTLDFKNNGNFNIGGYFIHATDSPNEELATIDLTEENTDANSKLATGIKFGQEGDNFLTPGERASDQYDLTEIGDVYSVDILPLRWQEEKNRIRLVSCKDAKTTETIDCNGIGGGACTPAPDPTLSGICGSAVCGTAQNGTCGSVTCPPDSCAPNVCVGGQCVPTTTSCNGVWSPPEDSGVECDGTPLPANCLSDCTCEGDYVPDGNGGCEIPTSVNSCPGYCQFLGYTTVPPGYCTNSEGNCVSGGGTYETIGDQWCTGGAQADSCCCSPVEMQLSYFGFESGNQGWSDPGSDSDRSSAFSKVDDDGLNGGTHSWHLQDNSNSAYTQQTFDFSGLSQIKLEWFGRYHDYENDEPVPDCIQLKVDGVVVESWGRSTNCGNSTFTTQDTWFAHGITISDSQYPLDSSVTLRFESTSDVDADDFYLDGLKITRIV